MIFFQIFLPIPKILKKFQILFFNRTLFLQQNTVSSTLGIVKKLEKSPHFKLVEKSFNNYLSMDDIFPFLQKYYFPLLEFNPNELSRWLTNSIKSAQPSNGLSSNLRKQNSAPEWIIAKETNLSDKLFFRWMSDNPSDSNDPSKRSSLEQIFFSSKLEERQPTGFIKNKLVKKQIDDLFSSAQTFEVLAVRMPNGEKIPVNLYLSQKSDLFSSFVSPFITSIFLHYENTKWVAAPMTRILYLLLAQSLIPIYGIWNDIHGTLSVEKLTVVHYKMILFIKKFLKSNLTSLLKEHVISKEKSISKHTTKIIFEFKNLCLDLIDQNIQHITNFIRFISAQTGGRILLPNVKTGFSGSNEWSAQFPDSANEKTITLTFDENLKYDFSPSTKKGNVKLWILRRIWPQLRTAAFLVNQTGSFFAINDGNNRWGGKHPPHSSHRQGVSIDFDIGWNNKKIPNLNSLKKSEWNHSSKNCLHGFDRLLGMIGIQSFLLSGITQYLYGDKNLLEDSFQHLNTSFLDANFLEPTWDPKSHNDHFHFEIALNPRSCDKKNNLVWGIKSQTNLLELLYIKAIKRNSDIQFWQKMTGMEKIPESENDFDTMKNNGVNENEIKKWKDWWNRENLPSGVSLLPVWDVGGYAFISREYNEC